jgi:hypothetical protein
MHPNIIGALINSSLYLACVFIAGIVTAHPIAWKFALITMGVTYLQHTIGIVAAYEFGAWQTVSIALLWLTIALGAVSGLSLLF